MRILLLNFYPVINASGGTEKIFAKVANRFSQRGHAVTAAFFENKHGKPFYHFDSSIQLINLYKKDQLTVWNRLLLKIKNFHILARRRHRKERKYQSKFIKNIVCEYLSKNQFDIIFVFQPESIKYLPENKSVKTVLTLHGAASYYFDYYDYERLLYALKYPDIVTVLLPSYKSQIQQYTTAKVLQIPNGISSTLIRYYRDKSSKKIIYLARVSSRKQHHLLIEAFSKIKNQLVGWTIEFWGDCTCDVSYFEFLKKLVKRYKLRETVLFCGVTSNVAEKLSQAQICVFPSKYEGFGMGLLEAMAVGLPCIGFKTSPGVNELITNYDNGILVDNSVNALACGILELIQNRTLQEKMSYHAKLFAKSFDDENVFFKWERLLKNTVDL